jgi:hypothetical protein
VGGADVEDALADAVPWVRALPGVGAEGDPVTGQDAMSDGGKGRDGYTWDDACTDLALESRLTLSDTAAIKLALEPIGVHPYDAVPPLAALFGDGDMRSRAHALRVLIAREELE